MIREFVQSLRKRFETDKTTELRSKHAAVLGDLSGTLDAGGGLVYATCFDGHVLKVVNRIAPNIAGRHVIIGMRDGVLQVVVDRDVFGVRDTLPHLPSHAETHQYPGHDTLFVTIDQILPLLVLPTSGITVQVYGGVLSNVNGRFAVENQTIDLSSYQPSSGAKFVAIETDTNGNLSVVEGETISSPEELSLADIPQGSGIGFVAVRLYDGQEELRRDRYINDFVDLRSFIPAASGHYAQFIFAVSGGDFGFIRTEDGDPVTALFDLE